MTAPDRETLVTAAHRTIHNHACAAKTARECWAVAAANRTVDRLTDLLGPLAPPAAALGPEGEAVERVRALAKAIEQVATHFTLDGALQAAGYDQGGTSVARRIIAARDLARLLAAVDRLTAAEQRLRVARQALVSTGYFTEDEVGPDVAPRITELWSARTEETTRLTQMLREAREQRDAARGLAFRAAFAPEGPGDD